MAFGIGWEQENESNFFIYYKNKHYGDHISNLFNFPKIQKVLDIRFNLTQTAFSNKYGILFNNIFFFPLLKNYWSVDFEIASKTKNMRLINFDFTPMFKLTFANEDFPLNFKFKYSHLEASKSQLFEQHDYSSVLQSILPYHRFVFSVNHSNNVSFNLLRNNMEMIYKNKIAYSKIVGYEEAIKCSGAVKFLYKIPFKDYFSVALSNESIIKKSFIYNNSFKEKRHKDRNHIKSLFDCNSKLINISIRHNEKVIENSSDLVLQNVSFLRINDIFFLKNNELLSRVEPFVGLETILTPEIGKLKTREDFKNSLYAFLNLGFSIKMNENMRLNLCVKTFNLTENCKIDKKQVGKFRINLDINYSL
jgi:hypothetical protein